MVKGDFEYAIRRFRQMGDLQLPERVDSIPSTSILGRLLEPFSDQHGEWEEEVGWDAEGKLLAFLDKNPGQPAVWQSLARVYVRLERYKDAVASMDEAIALAPYEAEFHWEAALVYVTAVENAVEPNLQLGLVGKGMADCNLGALSCSYEEARSSCITHLEGVVGSSRPDSERYRLRARSVLAWCVTRP